MIANSGRFKHTKAYLLGDKPFESFMALSNWLHAETDQTHKIALPRLFALLRTAMVELLKRDVEQTESCLLKDFAASGIKGQPKFLSQQKKQSTTLLKRRSESRQQRHRIN